MITNVTAQSFSSSRSGRITMSEVGNCQKSACERMQCLDAHRASEHARAYVPRGRDTEPVVLFEPLRVPLHMRAQQALWQLLRRSCPDDGTFRQWPDRSPIVEVRCRKAHRMARVYNTDHGPLFVSWPKPALRDRVERSGVIRITSPRGHLEPVVDLLDIDHDGEQHPTLLSWCRCGRTLPADREQVRRLARDVALGKLRGPGILALT